LAGFVSRRKVAERYNVSVHAVGALARGETWNDDLSKVEGDVPGAGAVEVEQTTAVAAVVP
jgi:hypothetical protein